MRKLMLGCLIAALPAWPALAGWQLVGPWIARPDSVACESHFAMKDAEAARQLGDQKWLSELGCAVSQYSWRMRAVIDGNPNEPNDILRVRIDRDGGSVTAYIRNRNVLIVHDGELRTLACMHGGGWRC